jgi:DNA (cytosine-5)-methyltransferase 1
MALRHRSGKSSRLLPSSEGKERLAQGCSDQEACVNAYYNEIDPFAAQWLRNLIAAGHIAPGEVDERSIEDVRPRDLHGFTQCHFFAGIGVWSHALRTAGWDDSRPVWTGSCPCQPFSAAGKGKGTADERHLWPAWHYLIQQCRPGIIFGEQVASPAGLAWLDIVQADLEATGYASGAIDLCAAGVGAPHIRQRTYLVAIAGDERCEGLGLQLCERGPQSALPEARRSGEARIVGHADDAGPQGRGERGDGADQCAARSAGVVGGMADNKARRRGEVDSLARGGDEGIRAQGSERLGSGRSSFWSGCDWIPCQDGKARPVEPGTFPLAHGTSARVGRLRAYGNAIVAPLAAEFIESFLDVEPTL